jgi:pimeloyl-ACP methyl ester carboxylesterase
MGAAIVLGLVVAIGAALAAPASPALPTTSRLQAKTPTLMGRCGSAAKGFRRVQFITSDGARLTGAVRGSGRVGIVFAHQTDGTLCDWLPYAKTLAVNRIVLAIDFRGNGQSSLPKDVSASGRFDIDVAAAVDELRSRGAKRIVLIGASLGGTSVLAATRILEPQVNGLVSLSGPVSYGDLDANAAIGPLRIPLLLAVAAGDAFAPDARMLARKAKANRRAALLIVPGVAHGWDLVAVGAPTAKRVDTAVRSVIAAANR